MKQWKFIEALGGGTYTEVDTVQRQGSVCLDIPDVGASWFPINVLSVVVEFPPEPETGAVRLDRHGHVWQNIGSERGDWCCVAEDLGADWEELNRAYGPLVEYIPAPEPVELPWVAQCATGIGDTLHVCDPDGDSQVPVIVPGRSSVYLTPENARAGGYALLAAADQAEAATS